MDAEREAVPDLLKESDCGALIAGIVDLQHADARAVVDGGELIEPLAGPGDALEELHVQRQAVPRLGLLVASPALMVRLVLLIGRQPAQAVLAQDPVHGGAGNPHLMKALEVGGNPPRPEVVPLPQVQDLAYHLARGRPRRALRRPGAVAQSRLPVHLKPSFPPIERGSGDAEMTARPSHLTRLVCRPSQDLQSPREDPRLLCLRHRSSSRRIGPEKRAECVTRLLGFHRLSLSTDSLHLIPSTWFTHFRIWGSAPRCLGKSVSRWMNASA